MEYKRQYADELHDSWGLEHFGDFDHANLRMWPGVPQLDPRQAYLDGKPVTNKLFTLIAGVYQPYGNTLSTIEYDYEGKQWLVMWRTGNSSCTTSEHPTEASAFEEFCQELMFQNPLDFVTNRASPKPNYDDSKGYGSWA